MRNTASVIDGKPIAVWSQSISDVSAINSLVAFYDIHGGKREVVLFYFVPDTTRDVNVDYYNKLYLGSTDSWHTASQACTEILHVFVWAIKLLLLFTPIWNFGVGTTSIIFLTLTRCCTIMLSAVYLTRQQITAGISVGVWNQWSQWGFW
jgi:hypothetical protein